MKFICAVCAGIFSWLVVTPVSAQVEVQFSQQRSLYLQYESIDLTLELTNVTDAPFSLSANDDGKSWLGFLVFNQASGVVNQVKSITAKQINLAPGETKRISVDILPYYAIRSTGGYTAQAIVHIPGLKPIMTGKLYFTVGKGETIWTQDVYNTGVKRVYSLVRFLDVNEANLYLRVEEPDQNLMYNTVRLGKVVSFADPQIAFDRTGNLHIVQVISAKNYRYTEADANGGILAQEDRQSIAGVMTPTLARSDHGTVQFVGGLTKKDATERAKLSETQTIPLSASGVAR
ncbi:MAG: hypothetical protein LBK76_01700 [Verrucomicrobiales bacterium]|jgi:hypothetical protein|nr:hypothetical protein [Verrucomicrobiales bacterium]